MEVEEKWGVILTPTFPPPCVFASCNDCGFKVNFLTFFSESINTFDALSFRWSPDTISFFHDRVTKPNRHPIARCQVRERGGVSPTPTLAGYI